MVILLKLLNLFHLFFHQMDILKLFYYLPKYVIFKVFQVHLQVLVLLKNNGYKSFYITFEGLNVDE